jgi:uncharacterized protein (TIGR03790 family)
MKLAGMMAGILALAGCAQIDAKLNSLRPKQNPAPSASAPSGSASLDSRRVMVVINTRSSDSVAVGEYYVRRRGIPSHHVMRVSVSEKEEIPRTEYKSAIEGPLRAKLKSLPTVDFVVLTRGIPIRVDGPDGQSVDSLLVSMQLAGPGTNQEESAARIRNPYGAAQEPFSSQKFKMHLVTRLDGYTLADAKKLVDNSLLAKRQRGLFLMDEADNRRDDAYRVYQDNFQAAEKALRSRGLEVQIEKTGVFASSTQKLMGYVSWGSNDAAFREDVYRGLRFHPGAIAETFVSTSARTLRPTQGGQSLIGDLIASGVTGVKGYVSEPYAFALAQPQVLFDRYTRGLNLAEAFYAASPVVRWKDIVIGDPLCRPYR